MSTQGAEKKFTSIVDSILQFYDASRSPKSEVGYLPSTISIEPTNRCNLRCLHCHHADPAHPSRQKSGFMDMAVYRKIIDEIRHWASHITLNVHGEPLLHKNIVEMVRYAKEGGLSVSLLTNATMLKPEVTHALVEAQLDRIVFSFEGSCSEIHEKVRYGSNFKRTLGNILYFMVHNQRYGTPPTFICMSMVDSMYTHEDSQVYKDYFSKLPVNTVFLNKALNFSGTTQFGREVPVSQKIHLPFHEQPACRLPWELMTVCWDGSVSACPVDHTETHIIGNVATESLEAIWNSDRMQKFRQCHIDRDFEWIEAQGTLCSGCNARLDDPEYDLFNSRDLVLKKIVRQAQVYSQQLAGGESIFESSDVSSQKLAFAEEELQKNSQR